LRERSNASDRSGFPCPQNTNRELAAMIVHLNDDHRVAREQIAEWPMQESDG
jgi:hypothetical protein